MFLSVSITPVVYILPFVTAKTAKANMFYLLVVMFHCLHVFNLPSVCSYFMHSVALSPCMHE